MIDRDDLTNGVRAQLITAADGVSLLGIKVLWTIKSEYLNCQLLNLRVQLNPGQHLSLSLLLAILRINEESQDLVYLHNICK